MAELLSKREIIEELIKRWDDGATFKIITEGFSKNMVSLTPNELNQIAAELRKAGLPREKMERFRELCLAVAGQQLGENNLELMDCGCLDGS